MGSPGLVAIAVAALPVAASAGETASLPPTAALTWQAITLTAVRSAVITADGAPRPVLQAEGSR
jgi:hypothetical protein